MPKFRSWSFETAYKNDACFQANVEYVRCNTLKISAYLPLTVKTHPQPFPKQGRELDNFLSLEEGQVDREAGQIGSKPTLDFRQKTTLN